MVFVSHASTDSWIARKVAEDIEALGAEVFLDVSDIQTGDDFDEEVRRSVLEADEMLVLISPATMRNLWVFMEMGAARTLRKRLVLILINVSPNELPSPINRHLAQELNHIENYYAELSKRMSGKLADQEVIVTTLPDRKGAFNVDDQVTILSKPADPDVFPVLNESMRSYLGRSAKIIAEGWTEQDIRTFRLDVDHGWFLWAERWLQREDGGVSGDEATIVLPPDSKIVMRRDTSLKDDE